MSVNIVFNYESEIADLRKQREVLVSQRDGLTQTIAQIDRAISNFAALSNINTAPPAASVLPIVDGHQAAQKQASDSTETGDGLPFLLKAEVALIVDGMTGEITQPKIRHVIFDKYPEVASIAKERQLGARIAGELKGLVNAGVLILEKEGTSNLPHVFKKVSEIKAKTEG